MNQETRWNTRYREAGDDYLFGTEPNRFLAHRAALLRNGRTALSVADGEGRNSVWLAEQGLDVTAVEISPIAVEKARRLAAGRNQAIRFLLADMLAPDWPPAELHNAFDWVIGIFIQFVGAAERVARRSVSVDFWSLRAGVSAARSATGLTPICPRRRRRPPLIAECSGGKLAAWSTRSA